MTPGRGRPTMPTAGPPRRRIGAYRNPVDGTTKRTAHPTVLIGPEMGRRVDFGATVAPLEPIWTLGGNSRRCHRPGGSTTPRAPPPVRARCRGSRTAETGRRHHHVRRGQVHPELPESWMATRRARSSPGPTERGGAHGGRRTGLGGGIGAGLDGRDRGQAGRHDFLQELAEKRRAPGDQSVHVPERTTRRSAPSPERAATSGATSQPSGL